MDMRLAIDRVGSLLEANLTDPVASTRIGSYVFGPDMELNFNKYMPKVQVTDRRIDVPRNSKSFGQPFQKTKEAQIIVAYHNKKGDKYTTGGVTYRDRDYTHFFLQEIENVLGSNLSNIGLHGMIIGTVERIGYVPEYQTYVGIIPIAFTWRL